MKLHQKVFEKIKTILSKQFGEEIHEYEGGNAISIGDTDVWISCSSIELTVGYGINHRHYVNERELILEAIDELFGLITRRKRVTEFFKGKTLFKAKTEIEISNGKFLNLGTTMVLFYPYWKKTEKKVRLEEKFLNPAEIEKDLIELKKLCTTTHIPHAYPYTKF